MELFILYFGVTALIRFAAYVIELIYKDLRKKVRNYARNGL